MKGVIFTEFLQMVDDVFSPETTEQIIQESDLPSGGSYTAVGTYDHAEIVALATNLSKATKTPVPDLTKAFGRHLLTRFADLYPEFFSDIPDALTFIEQVDGFIHVEVRKLYPDAAVPQIETERIGQNRLVVTYRSDRHLGDVAEGLIQGAIDHFGHPASLERCDQDALGDKQCVRFTVEHTAQQAA